MTNYSELYDYIYEVLSNTVNDFTDRCVQKCVIDQFLSIVIEFENYLSSTYPNCLVHAMVNGALREVCKERDCIEWWNLYSCEVTQ